MSESYRGLCSILLKESGEVIYSTNKERLKEHIDTYGEQDLLLAAVKLITTIQVVASDSYKAKITPPEILSILKYHNKDKV